MENQYKIRIKVIKFLKWRIKLKREDSRACQREVKKEGGSELCWEETAVEGGDEQEVSGGVDRSTLPALISD